MTETKQVPVEPTGKMLWEGFPLRSDEQAREDYKRLLAAAPAAEPSEVGRLAVEIADSASKQIINQWVYGSGPGKGYIDRHGIGPDWLQKCIDYADLRGLLEYHPDHPEWVRVKGEKS